MVSACIRKCRCLGLVLVLVKIKNVRYLLRRSNVKFGTVRSHILEHENCDSGTIQIRSQILLKLIKARYKTYTYEFIHFKRGTVLCILNLSFHSSVTRGPRVWRIFSRGATDQDSTLINRWKLVHTGISTTYHNQTSEQIGK